MPESDLTAISAITAKLLASVYGAGSLALALNVLVQLLVLLAWLAL